MPWCQSKQGGNPKLTAIQREHLLRFAAGGAFTGSVAEFRLISMGLLRVTAAEPTVQGLLVVAKMSETGEQSTDA